jgi:hypothetical protein
MTSLIESQRHRLIRLGIVVPSTLVSLGLVLYGMRGEPDRRD